MPKIIQNFKKQSNLWMFGTLVFILYAATKPVQPAGVIDHFKVGDVVYSVLNETQFIQLHGNSWKLMDGSTIAIDKDLHKTFGWVSVPDGRGVFIRGMNVGRSKNTGDPNTDANGNREIGSYQSDMIKKHKHDMSWFTGGPNGRYGGGGGLIINDNITATQFNNDGNDFETRPRNIALYTYIKINEQ